MEHTMLRVGDDPCVASSSCTHNMHSPCPSYLPSKPLRSTDSFPLLHIQVGVVDVADEEVVKKGRLMPGNIFLVDFDEHRVVEDKEVRGRRQGDRMNVCAECRGGISSILLSYSNHVQYDKSSLQESVSLG